MNLHLCSFYEYLLNSVCVRQFCTPEYSKGCRGNVALRTYTRHTFCDVTRTRVLSERSCITVTCWK